VGGGRTTTYTSRVTAPHYHGSTIFWVPHFYGTNPAYYERSDVPPQPCVTKSLGANLTLWLGATCPLAAGQQDCVDDVLQAYLDPAAAPVACAASPDGQTTTLTLRSFLMPLEWRVVINASPECQAIVDDLRARLDALVTCEREKSGVDWLIVFIGALILLMLVSLVIGSVYAIVAGCRHPMGEEEEYLLTPRVQ